jgi:hypothetical protein
VSNLIKRIWKSKNYIVKYMEAKIQIKQYECNPVSKKHGSKKKPHSNANHDQIVVELLK